MTHTKTVEQQVLGNQQEMLSRRDIHQTKLSELRGELDENVRAKEQQERLIHQLADELRGVKSKVDNQSSDFGGVMNDLKNKNRKLEEEARQTLEALRKTGETQNMADSNTTNLRSQ